MHLLATVPFFFVNDTATTEIYTLSLHDALPILPTPPGPTIVTSAFVGSDCVSWRSSCSRPISADGRHGSVRAGGDMTGPDRKSTRLNSSHANISYAVFCLKKKKSASLHRSNADL